MRTRSRKLHSGFRILAAVVFLLTCLLAGQGKASEAAYPELRSMDQLYAEMLDQIYTREVTRYYTVKDQSLRDRMVNMKLDTLAAHFDEQDPLRSGCYLCYYVETVYLSYYGTQFKVMIKFPHSKDDMDRHFEKMKKLAGELRGETEFDTVKNVHDYLIDNFEYDRKTTMVNHTDIDGFRDGEMVCSGYSLAAYYLLNSAGVKTRVITGSGGSGADVENHMWNMVRVDGKWYNLDVTWDDGGGTRKLYDYFLKSDADFPDHKRLGRCDTEELRNMVSDTSYSLPVNMTFLRPMYILSVLLLLLILFLAVREIRRRKAVTEYRGYVIEDTDLYEGSPERDYESWKDGGNGYV